MAALKGKGKGKGTKGKYGKGNYKGGYKGKNNWYKSPGKAIGKGSINYNGLDEDYWSAWGCEGDDWNNCYIGEDYGNYYIGNAAMLLETANNNEDTKTIETTAKLDDFRPVTSKRNALTGTLGQ